MTGAEFATYVKRKFIRTDKDTELFEAVTDVIAEINVRIKSDYYKEEAYVAGIETVGEYQIALPSDFGNIIGNVSIVDTASDDEYNPLQKISKNRYDMLYSDRSLTDVNKVNTAVPVHFCIFAGQIYIGPVPDLTTYRFQINYTTDNTTAITTDTAVVPYTEVLRHRNVLRNGVLFELHDGLENFEEAAYYKSTFLDGLDKMEKQEMRNLAPTNENTVYHGI